VTTDLRAITETGGMRADADQLAMARLRHSLVAGLARGRDLLDVACGSGYALPLIAREARSVTACDRDPTNIGEARAVLPSGSCCLSDAGHLPFRDASFDVVACLEAIYYLPDWPGFVRGAGRVLRPGGTLVTSWPNPARPAFHRSPGSTAYPGAAEMVEAADGAGFDGVCYGAFPIDTLATAHRPGLDALRRAAVRLHLIPQSLGGRALLKRLLYRNLTPLSQVDLLPDPFEHLVKLTQDTSGDFAMLYYVGDKR